NLLSNTSQDIVRYSKNSWDWDVQYLSPNDLERLGISIGDDLTLRVYIDKPEQDARAFIQFATDVPTYRQNYGNYIRIGESGWSVLTIKITEEDLSDLRRISFAVRGTIGAS